MFQCPHCQAQFTSIFYRDKHVKDFHHSMGWYEGQQPTIDDKSGKVELKAIEHQLAKKREEFEKQRPISQPIPPPITRPPKESLNIPEGWLKTIGSYVYEHEIFRHHSTENSTIGILHATLNNHYIKCLLHTYDKNLSEVARLHEKEAILEGRLASYVPSDPAFPQIASELHKVKSEITYLTKTLRPDEIHHLIFEEYSKFTSDSDENIKWQSDMMQRTLSEAERLKNNYQRQHESDSK